MPYMTNSSNNTYYVAQTYDKTGEIHLFEATKNGFSFSIANHPLCEANSKTQGIPKDKNASYSLRDEGKTVLTASKMRIVCAYCENKKLFNNDMNICGICVSSLYKTPNQKSPQGQEISYRCDELCSTRLDELKEKLPNRID